MTSASDGTLDSAQGHPGSHEKSKRTEANQSQEAQRGQKQRQSTETNPVKSPRTQDQSTDPSTADGK